MLMVIFIQDNDGVAGLLPQNPRHFARQPSARDSQNLRSYLSHMIAVDTGISTSPTAKTD
jgi:hypothetical protein